MRAWTLAAVAVLVLATWTHVSEALCPHCTCPAQYELVCARRRDTSRLRGFSSRCVLDCENMCRPARKQFDFVKKGRCGKPRPTSTASTTAPLPLQRRRTGDKD